MPVFFSNLGKNSVKMEVLLSSGMAGLLVKTRNNFIKIFKEIILMIRGTRDGDEAGKCNRFRKKARKPAKKC